MKKTLIILFTLFTANYIFAQTITSVTSKLDGKNIIVNYNITGSTTGQTFNVTLWYGITKTACTKQAISCNGDIGEGITSGNSKKITWAVTDDLDNLKGSLYFKVRAEVIEKEIDDEIIKDGDGNIYTTVTIGTQVWLKENLKTTKYNDGTAIPNVTDDTKWSKLTSPAFCWYKNDSTTYKEVFGALYNWFAVDKKSNGNNNVCPLGYHVPTDAEWTTLTTYLGGESVAGGKLKEEGTTHWNDPNTNATNSSVFTAIPGGLRYGSSGTFNDLGANGYWWSSTAYDALYSWYRSLNYSYCNVYRYSPNKQNGFSVRCKKEI